MDNVNEDEIEPFTFKGWMFGLGNSARDQRCCPHCGTLSKRGGAIDEEEEDMFDYLGEKQLNEKWVAHCFVCLACGGKLWYHVAHVPDVPVTKLNVPRGRGR